MESGAGAPAKASPPPETTLGLELDGGFSSRLGEPSDFGYTSSERTGISFGPSLWLAPNRLWSIGLAYQRSRVGSDRTDPIEGSLSIKRDLDALWLGGRAYPWRSDALGLFVGLGLGMSWQHVSADGTRASGELVRPEQPFSCSGSEGPGVALGGGVGLDVDIATDIAFLTQLNATAHRHTSDTVAGCAPGSGSITTLGAQIGFAYRFDLEAGPRAGGSAAGSRTPTRL